MRPNCRVRCGKSAAPGTHLYNPTSLSWQRQASAAHLTRPVHMTACKPKGFQDPDFGARLASGIAFEAMFPDNQPWEIRDVIQRVMEYVVENPDAKDTLEGIDRWWLRGSGPNPSRNQVECALNALVHAGWMNRIGDFRPVFQASRLGLKAGMNYLNQIYRNLN